MFGKHYTVLTFIKEFPEGRPSPIILIGSRYNSIPSHHYGEFIVRATVTEVIAKHCIISEWVTNSNWSINVCTRNSFTRYLIWLYYI